MKLCFVGQFAGMFLLSSILTSNHALATGWIFGKPDIQVIAVTDMTPEGRLTRVPTQSNPVYYFAVNLGYQDFGGVIAGDKFPPGNDVINMIGVALSKQGYLPATDKTPPPTMVLTLCWGTLYADTIGTGNPNASSQVTNRQQILNFLGGKKMGYSSNDFEPLTAPIMGMDSKNADARDFYDASADNYFVAAVGAYDLEAMKNKKRVLLWTTRISCPSRRLNLQEVLPTMMTVGKEYFGRETAKPVWVHASDKFKANVTFGELKVLDYVLPAPVQEEK